MQQLPALAGLGAWGLRKTLEAAHDASLISSAPLRSGVRYWYLTARGVTANG